MFRCSDFADTQLHALGIWLNQQVQIKQEQITKLETSVASLRSELNQERCRNEELNKKLQEGQRTLNENLKEYLTTDQIEAEL